MSSLNDVLFQKIKKLLHERPSIHTSVKDSLFNLCQWTPELMDEVNKKILEDDMSEVRLIELLEWANFVFVHFTYLEKPQPGEQVLPKKIFQLCEAILFIFKFATRTIKIPYKYWSDIAPHMLQEARRFYLTSYDWDRFLLEDLNFKPIEEKKGQLRKNPETAELFAQWENDHLFS